MTIDRRTMDEIARLAGVSKATVSRVMSGSTLVKEATRQRIMGIAREQGYAVNRSARRLRQNRAQTIALVLDLPSLPNQRVSQPFHFELFADVLKAVNARKHDVLLHSPDDESIGTYEDMVASQLADGVIFIGQGQRMPVLRALADTSVPFVVWGVADPDERYCTVGTDNRLGGRLAARRFVALGRARIVFVGPLSHHEILARKEGLEAGLSGSGEAYALDVLEPADLSYEAFLAAIRAYLDRDAPPPDAIFCASDTGALAAIAALSDRALRVPRDVSVIGYDDIPQAYQVRPTLTSIRQDTQLAAALLVDCLMQQIAGETATSAVMPTELIIRES
ncbi:LacI family DNA-binding transcriptional regulator [Sphingomonas sp. A2-49]|uniref:LacI family DNA-binding transcriptional regulator n=1 Tax=Sphingomonas sp. A2-49 TaxID=1391375 RepID=UPI0021D1BD48|nr:LacI family DNA-binding transcriptional regulator [Sphingomonas sp. A2-49]MCU6455550.1 LacI family DNA-binding transcriptional regulator [Sphingomonas sp. A2-49]